MKRIDFVDDNGEPIPDGEMFGGTIEPTCDECQKQNGAVVLIGGPSGILNVCRDCLLAALDMVGGP